KLHFKNGLCVKAEIANGSDWAYPDLSPLSGIQFQIQFEGNEWLGIWIDKGRIVCVESAKNLPSKRNFPSNLPVARQLFFHPQLVMREEADAEQEAKRLARAAVWLTSRSVEGFDSADFSELEPSHLCRLRDAVQEFRDVAKQVPSDQPATDEQFRKGAK